MVRGDVSTERTGSDGLESEARVLVACRACGRQYDVSGFELGTHVRCECTALLTVEARRAVPFQPRRCGQCGAAVSADARCCEYCHGEITLEEHGLSSLCPVCFARLSRDANFCMACGVAIQPQALKALRLGVACPRCKGALRSRIVDQFSLVECTGCGGLWLDETLLDSICEHTERASLLQHEFESTRPVSASTATGSVYIPCLTCGQMMSRQNFGQCSGVIIDRCKDHGVWLDHRELAAIVDFVRQGGLARARARDVERWRAEKARRASTPLVGVGDPRLESDADVGLPDVLGWIARRLLRGSSR